MITVEIKSDHREDSSVDEEYAKTSFPSGEVWPEVLRGFLRALGFVYGYEISEERASAELRGDDDTSDDEKDGPDEERVGFTDIEGR